MLSLFTYIPTKCIQDFKTILISLILVFISLILVWLTLINTTIKGDVKNKKKTTILHQSNWNYMFQSKLSNHLKKPF